MSRVIIGSILGSVGVIVVSVVTAATYIGALSERVDNIEKWMDKEPERIQEALDAFVNAASRHSGMIEKGFNNPTSWGKWSEPVYCPPGYYVCGMKQRVEAPIDGDDTGMNAVAFYCCPLDPKAKPQQ